MTSNPKNHPPVKNLRFPKMSKTNTPLVANEFNAKAFLDGYGVEFKYNGMLFDVETTILQADGVNRGAVSDDWLLTRAEHHGLRKEFVYRFIVSHAPHYHPVLDWLGSIPAWDGEDHIGRFMDCLTLGAEIPPEQARTLVTTWLIGAVSAPHNGYEDRPIDQGPPVLVLIGPQGIGKSRLLAKLVPDRSWVKTEQTLVTADNDSVMALTRCWLVELGELDETMRRNSDSSAKQFLTRVEDVYRQPYARREVRCPRRTAYIASINERRFLRDPTGNRRFLPLPVERIDLDSLPDPAELWGQAYALFKEGRPWWLTPDEGKALAGLQENFKQVDGLVQIMADFFVPLAADDKPSRGMSMADIQRYLADKKINCNPKDTAKALRAAGIVLKATRSNNKWMCVIRGNQYDDVQPAEPTAEQVSADEQALDQTDTEPFFTSLPEGEAGE